MALQCLTEIDQILTILKTQASCSGHKIHPYTENQLILTNEHAENLTPTNGNINLTCAH